MQKQCLDQICIFCWLISCTKMHDMLSPIDDMLIHFIFTGIDGMVVKCCSCVSLLLSSRCCHMWKSSAETFTIKRFPMFKETLMSKFEVWYLGGRWKFDKWHAASCRYPQNMYRFSYSNECCSLLGHINVMVLAGIESGVVRIQTSGDICVGRYTSEVFLICNGHCEVIPARFFAYRAEIHNGGFANGWKGGGMLQNCPFAAWQTWNWVGESPLPWIHP